MNLLNPKGTVSFPAFLPQFANPGTSGTALRLVVLELVFALLSVVVFSCIALFSGLLGDRLSSNPRYATALRWLTGCVLVGLELRLLSPALWMRERHAESHIFIYCVNILGSLLACGRRAAGTLGSRELPDLDSNLD